MIVAHTHVSAHAQTWRETLESGDTYLEFRNSNYYQLDSSNIDKLIDRQSREQKGIDRYRYWGPVTN